ncbi:MAG: ATP-binding cassette domain-containing protein [Alteromonadaceae bacterium]|nr:ATP-binding cassette domain-containing protein [Alteromonadaceae bacterium]
MSNIVVENLCHSYGAKPALQAIDLVIRPGFNVVLGPNGAGKSTLFSLLTGILPAQKGQVRYDQQDIKTQRRSIMHRLGVVFQQPTLDLNLSVQQNLTYFGALHGIAKVSVMQRCEPLLQSFGLTERLSDCTRSLNQGHRRRLEIIRALIHQPQFLLLDEATVGLDADTRQLVLNTLREYVTDNNVTLLWTTHLMDEVDKEDVLTLLHKGKVKAQGKTKDLLAHAKCSSVFEWYCSLTQTVEAM